MGEAWTYEGSTTPTGYACACGAKGVKLWRPAQCEKPLRCVRCAIEHGRSSPRVVRKLTGRVRVDANGKSGDRYGHTDQLAGLLPAVPTPENDNFWGYTSVPRAGVDWWKRLPLIVTGGLRVFEVEL